MGVGTGRVAMALEGGYELMSLCASAEACMRALLGYEVHCTHIHVPLHVTATLGHNCPVCACISDCCLSVTEKKVKTGL